MIPGSRLVFHVKISKQDGCKLTPESSSCAQPCGNVSMKTGGMKKGDRLPVIIWRHLLATSCHFRLACHSFFPGNLARASEDSACAELEAGCEMVYRGIWSRHAVLVNCGSGTAVALAHLCHGTAQKKPANLILLILARRARGPSNKRHFGFDVISVHLPT